MGLTTVRPPGFDPSKGDYSYDDGNGTTYYGTYGDNSVLPLTPSGQGDLNAKATGLGDFGGGGGGGGGYGAGAKASGLADLIDSMAYGNTQDYALRKWIAEQNAKQAEQSAQQAQRNTYANTATSILDAATRLRGPADYYQFNKLTSGGRDVFDQLRGNTPRADFSGAGAGMMPASVADILKALGVPGFLGDGSGSSGGASPSGGAPSGAAGMGGVSQAQADQVADGLGIPRPIIYEYVQANSKLPDLGSLNDFMNQRGYRDPSSGRMTGKVPSTGWGGAASAAQSAAPVRGAAPVGVAGAGAPVVTPQPVSNLNNNAMAAAAATQAAVGGQDWNSRPDHAPWSYDDLVKAGLQDASSSTDRIGDHQVHDQDNG